MATAAVAVCAALWAAAPAWSQQSTLDGATAQWGWDIDSDGIVDSVGFATLLPTGQLIINGMILPPPLTGNPSPLRLGEGHGNWQYRQKDRSIHVRTFHANFMGGSEVWVITSHLTHIVGGQFRGMATIEQFASFADFRAGTMPMFTAYCGLEISLP